MFVEWKMKQQGNWKKIFLRSIIRIPSYKMLTESMTTIIVRLLESILHSSTYRDHFKLQPLFGQVLVKFPKLTSFKHTMSSLMFHSGEFHQRNPIYLTLWTEENNWKINRTQIIIESLWIHSGRVTHGWKE